MKPNDTYLLLNLFKWPIDRPGYDDAFKAMAATLKAKYNLTELGTYEFDNNGYKIAEFYGEYELVKDLITHEEQSPWFQFDNTVTFDDDSK